MKKATFIFLFIAGGLIGQAQTKDSTQKVDINNIPVLTISDIDRIDKAVLADMPSRYVDVIREAFRQVIAARLQQAQPKEAPKQPIKKK